MKILSFTLTSLAALSLSACASLPLVSKSLSPQDALLGGISEEHIKPVIEDTAATESGEAAADSTGLLSTLAPNVVLAESQIRSTFSNEACGQFNMNALAYAASPELPEGKQSLGTGIVKTLVMGTIAGAASGGVASLGIGSSFLEAMAVGTTNQLVFSGTRPVVDKVIPDIGVSVTSAEKTAEIKAAAARLDCEEPAWMDTISKTEASALLAKFSLETEAAEAASENLNLTDTPSVATTATEVTLSPAVEGLPLNCPAGTTAQDNGTCALN